MVMYVLYIKSAVILPLNGLRDLWNSLTRYAHYYQCIYTSYNTDESALRDIYARCPRASAYIRQRMSSCVITNMLHFWHSKSLSKPEVECSAIAYIVTDADCDCERYFIGVYNVSQRSMMYSIVLTSITGLYSH